MTLIRCPFHFRVTAATRKRFRSFCQKCRWQVTPKHAYTLDPAKSEYCCPDMLREPFIRKRAHTQLVGRLSATVVSAPGVKRGMCVRELISTWKKKNPQGKEWSNSLPKSSQARKKPPPPPTPPIPAFLFLILCQRPIQNTHESCCFCPKERRYSTKQRKSNSNIWTDLVMKGKGSRYRPSRLIDFFVLTSK